MSTTTTYAEQHLAEVGVILRRLDCALLERMADLLHLLATGQEAVEVVRNLVVAGLVQPGLAVDGRPSAAASGRFRLP